MNASSFIIFVTYMLRYNGKRFYEGLYVTFKLAKFETSYENGNSLLENTRKHKTYYFGKNSKYLVTKLLAI